MPCRCCECHTTTYRLYLSYGRVYCALHLPTADLPLYEQAHIIRLRARAVREQCAERRTAEQESPRATEVPAPQAAGAPEPDAGPQV